jgi:hypothetical protein
VKYNEKAGALQMVTRFFIDDFEDVLSERYEKKVVLNEQKDIDTVERLIDNYVQAKLETTIDGKSVKPDFLGAELEGDMILLYIELPTSVEPDFISMSFPALVELFPEQKNLIHFRIKKQRKTIIIDANKERGTIKF